MVMKSFRSLLHGGACVLALATGACASTPRFPVHYDEAIGTGGFSALKPRFATDFAGPMKVATAAPASHLAAAPPTKGQASMSSPPPEPVETKSLDAPKPPPKPVPTPPPIRVTVKAGDTIYDVAARNRSPVRGIIEANGLTPPYELHAGQVLLAPKPPVYFAQEGDSLYGVARRFMVDVRSLATLNDLTTQSRLRLGQPISLPSDARDSGPLSAAAIASVTPTSSPVAQPSAVVPTTRVAHQPPSSPAVQQPLPPPTYEPEPAPDATGASACSAPSPASRSRRTGRTVAEAYAAVERSPTAVAPDSDNFAANEPPPTAQTPFDIAAVSAGVGKFAWPVKGVILSTFGPKPTMAQNDGVDIGASYGTPVVATADGHVVFNGNVAGQGKTVLLKHYDDNWASVYGQLSRSLVKNEEKVRKGQVIACIGQAQNVPQPQLHFELRYRVTPTEKHKPVNPLLVLNPDQK